MEPAEAGPPEAATLPLPEPASGEASTDRAEMTPEERDRSPAARPRARSAQWGSRSGNKTPHPGGGEDWTCPVGKCQDSAAHPLDECGEFRGLSVTQRRKAIREWDRCECCLTDCRDRKTGIRCYRLIGFRRHHLLRLVSQTRADQAEGVGSSSLEERLTGQAGTPPMGSLARPAEDAAAAKGPRRRGRRICGASLQWAGRENWYGSEPPGVSTWA